MRMRVNVNKDPNKRSKKLACETQSKKHEIEQSIHNKFDWDMRDMTCQRVDFKIVNFVRCSYDKIENNRTLQYEKQSLLKVTTIEKFLSERVR